ncbi:uncharacterized protein LOC134269481 [Saccostrea cucullata]|uniref:uncharacterized protein LOC134269481 n=1 Tax=Saccostrea cuccullata TaxID=36930 RepID=UPI002ED569B1
MSTPNGEEIPSGDQLPSGEQQSEQTQEPTRTSDRVKVQTQKGQQHLQENIKKYREKLLHIENRIRSSIQECTSPSCSKELSVLISIRDKVEKNFEIYTHVYKESQDYMNRHNYSDSERILIDNSYRLVSQDTESCLTKLSETIRSLEEEVNTVSGRMSSASIRSLQRVEEAKTKLKNAEKVAELKRQKSELQFEEQLHAAKLKREQESLDTQLELLKHQEEVEIAETRVKFEMGEEERSCVDLGLPKVGGFEKSKTFIKNLPLNPQAEKFVPQLDKTLPSMSTTCVPETLQQPYNPQLVRPAINPPRPILAAYPRHPMQLTYPPQPMPSMYAPQTPRPMHPMYSAYTPRPMQPMYTQPTPSSAQPVVSQPMYTQPTPTSAQPVISQPSLESGNIHSHSNIQPQQFSSVPSTVIPTTTSATGNFMNSYMMKKDLISQRLRKYDDDPSSYNLWKGSFKSIVSEATLSPLEEIDLLLRWLGPDSTVQATRIRRANPCDTGAALNRIWQRLDERYGSPELIDSKLQSELKKFPVLQIPKDKTLLYNLVDLLGEIECNKNNPQYSLLLSYYDTPVGINPIVSKLPENLQNKWRDRAVKFKIKHNIPFPPFKELVKFIHELSVSLNDPGFVFDTSSPFAGKDKPKLTKKPTSVVSKKTDVHTGSDENPKKGSCPLHPNAISHFLDECQLFMKKPMEERRRYVLENKLCFKCLRTNCHTKRQCTERIKCKECGSNNHVTAMHVSYKRKLQDSCSQTAHGGETGLIKVDSKCTTVCNEFNGRSCAKTVLVRVYSEEHPETSATVYAMIDEHCNRTLASSELMDTLGVQGNELMYNLSSCSGKEHALGRQAYGFIVESLDSSTSLRLPTLIECRSIPQDVSEIPTPEIAEQYPHLRGISSEIPKYDPKHHIGLLIGRDLTEAHHVFQQIIGPKDNPFAQKTCFGWVIIGNVCLDGKHLPMLDNPSDITITSFKTSVLPSGRSTIFQPCDKELKILERDSGQDIDIFKRRHDDNIIGHSVEDREFLNLMEKEMKISACGNWTAPLPFRKDRPPLPNNKPMALKRAMILDSSLKKNDRKCQHFVTFMDKVIHSGAAEIAPELKDGQEVWYLPLFGVYHPKKKDQIRGVFDSSATFQGVSLNSVLLTGPNLTNNLVGVLLRCRKDAVAVSADIEQMFYSFLVNVNHRDYLRFLWYRDNDPNKELIEYCMCAHVFGNSPSPSVATFGLHKSTRNSDEDITEFVKNDFYVDDALTSLPTASQAVDLLKRTQTVLKNNGNIKLHKIASNHKDVMSAFSKEDLSKEIKLLDLEKDSLPIHQSLGLSWDLSTDSFVFHVDFAKKPNTRRGYLSMLHSIYDPLGFTGPLVIQGKIILREITALYDWDDEIDPSYVYRWESWKDSFTLLQQVTVPRMYFTKSLSQSETVELHVFCDASEQAVSAVSYMRLSTEMGIEVTFVFGKVKLAPLHGHTMPGLELCAALLAVDVAEILNMHLNVKFTTTKRFYNYVANRVERILRASNPSQWNYVKSTENPADLGTRGLNSAQNLYQEWLRGPEFLHLNTVTINESFPLINPEQDVEIRVSAKRTVINDFNLTGIFENFSSWDSLVSALTVLKTFIRKKKQIVSDPVTVRRDSESVIIKETQKTFFLDDIYCLQHKKPLQRDSSVLKLCPYLSEDGIMKVGGRLNLSVLSEELKNPIIIPKKSHVAKLIVQHFHEKSAHQGRHITEGAIRNKGYWIIGAKKVISSVIHKCVICRRLRGKFESQRMADLPPDRITPGPPFSAVGVDTFGPWTIVTRKTRGGQAESKRWAIMFTCLTTRAIHIELVESMSSSSFINALRRFIALRGNVSLFRSDRGTNFIGATEDLGIDVTKGPVKNFLDKSKIVWTFNAPHSSHMGGVWERMIGLTRRVLDTLLLGPKGKHLTHEVLSTLMAEVTAIINSRPITTISNDPELPFVLSPAMLLNQKISGHFSMCMDVDIRDIYKEQWKQVQVLSDLFWQQWKTHYLQNLQSRRKWTSEKTNMKVGDVVVVKDRESARCQ